MVDFAKPEPTSCQCCQYPPCDCCEAVEPTSVTITTTGFNLICEEYQKFLREECKGRVTITELNDVRRDASLVRSFCDWLAKCLGWLGLFR